MNYESFKKIFDSIKIFGLFNDLKIYKMIIEKYGIKQFDDETLEKMKSEIKKLIATKDFKWSDLLKKLFPSIWPMVVITFPLILGAIFNSPIPIGAIYICDFRFDMYF